LHQTSINDPNTFYTINDDFALILEASGKSAQSNLIQRWNASHQEKLPTIRARASQSDIAIEIGSLSISLSSEAHSQLTKEVCEIFAPAYISGFEPIYVSDTRDKLLYVNSALTADLNISLDEHDKLPDVILYRRSMNIVYVIEVVTSVGPVSQSRKQELNNLLMKKGALTFGLVYITAFPDRKTLRRFITDIAWETKVWIAEEHFGIINFDLIARTL
jgi:adenine-specific DNA-methyltransferase